MACLAFGFWRWVGGLGIGGLIVEGGRHTKYPSSQGLLHAPPGSLSYAGAFPKAAAPHDTQSPTASPAEVPPTSSANRMYGEYMDQTESIPAAPHNKKA
jgi:hypothetical protein